MNRSLAFVPAACVLAACSGAPQGFTPVVVDPSAQFVRTDVSTGGHSLLSVGPSSRVFLMQIDDEAYYRWGPTFQIKLVNDGQAPIKFGVGNIKVRQDGEFLQVHGARQIATAREEAHLSDVRVPPGREHAALISVPALDDDGPAEFTIQVDFDRHRIVLEPE